MGELIAVLSGKGGTGKTSICAGIAAALAASGEKVLCIDCDIGLRNLDIALGLQQSDALSFLDIARGHYPVERALRHPAYENLYFLTAPVNCRAGDIDKAAFSAMLRAARARFSYILLDAPAGVEQGFGLCAAYADRVIVVTCPEPAAMRDAARAGEMLELMGKCEVRLVVNRVRKKYFRMLKVTIDDAMDQTGLPLLGVVPEDPNVPLAAAFQTPLLKYSRRGAAAACRRIAKRIQGLSVPVSI